MKKLFVVLALFGMIGSASALTISPSERMSIRAGAAAGNTIVFVKGDKDKDKKKKNKKKKECCSADSANKGGCSKDGEKKKCCSGH